jgi:hypothetical protein
MRNAKSLGSTLSTNEQSGGRILADPMPANPSKLTELASWYREFAERARNPGYFGARLRMAKELDAEADYIEHMKPAEPQRRGVADR